VAIKGIGRGFIRELMNERARNGRFASFDEFCSRLYGRELNRRALESLIRAGAFDSMGCRRSQLLQVAEKVLEGIAEDSRRNVAGQLDLFSLGEDLASAAPARRLELPDIPEFPRREILAMEREATGLYLTGHPMDEYRETVRDAGAVPIGEVLNDFAEHPGGVRFRDEQNIVLAGVVAAARTRTTKNNSLMSYITLEDDTGSVELIAFQRALDNGGGYVREGAPLLVRGRISLRDEEVQVMADSFRPISDVESPAAAPEAKARTLYLRVTPEREGRMAKLEKILVMFPGEDKLVLVRYIDGQRRQFMARCLHHPALIAELTELFGKENVVLK